ncbi:MAG: NAD(+) diphosphatase [Clostridia bacterium]
MILGTESFSVQPLHQPPADDSLFLCFRNGRVLLAQADDAPQMPVYAQVRPLLPADTTPFELAHTSHGAIFVPSPFAEVPVLACDSLHYAPVSILHTMDDQAASVLASAHHLWNWYVANRFCGRCGQPLAPDGAERALRCAGCGRLLFPTIAPAVIVAITHGDHILLAQNARSEMRHYALIAGYVEVGETLEHAVHREVLEEVGLRVKDLRYLGDQPWGISGSLMFAFHAELDGSPEITLQQSELADAQWFSRDTLVAPSAHRVSIAFELIERFRRGELR